MVSNGLTTLPKLLLILRPFSSLTCTREGVSTQARRDHEIRTTFRHPLDQAAFQACEQRPQRLAAHRSPRQLL